MVFRGEDENCTCYVTTYNFPFFFYLYHFILVKLKMCVWTCVYVSKFICCRKILVKAKNVKETGNRASCFASLIVSSLLYGICDDPLGIPWGFHYRIKDPGHIQYFLIRIIKKNCLSISFRVNSKYYDIFRGVTFLFSLHSLEHIDRNMFHENRGEFRY